MALINKAVLLAALVLFAVVLHVSAVPVSTENAGVTGLSVDNDAGRWVHMRPTAEPCNHCEHMEEAPHRLHLTVCVQISSVLQQVLTCEVCQQAAGGI